jgi:hypothetical protein
VCLYKYLLALERNFNVYHAKCKWILLTYNKASVRNGLVIESKCILICTYNCDVVSATIERTVGLVTGFFGHLHW